MLAPAYDTAHTAYSLYLNGHYFMVFTVNFQLIILTAPKECPPLQVSSRYFTTRILIISKLYFYLFHYPVYSGATQSRQHPA